MTARAKVILAKYAKELEWRSDEWLPISAVTMFLLWQQRVSENMHWGNQAFLALCHFQKN